MPLYTKIKQDFMSARKNKTNAVGVLSCLVSDVQLIAKNAQRDVSDEDCLTAVKKLLKGVNETIANTGSDDAKAEKTLLESYLPAQLDAQAIQAIIAKEGLTDMPSVMKYFKMNLNGQFDGKVLSEIAKKMFS